MSLINKMLKDLETRQSSAVRVERPIFQDLHAARGERSPSRRASILALALLLGGVAGIYAWDRWGRRAGPAVSTSAPAPTVAQAPASTETTLPTTAQQAQSAAVAPLPKETVSAPRPTVAKKTDPDRIEKPKTAPARPVSQAKPQPVADAKFETGTARIEKTDRPYSAVELAESAYQEAARLRAQGNAAEAERRTRALLANHPTHIKARELLAGLQVESGRFVEAQDTLEQGIVQVPTHLAFRFQLARLYLERGDHAAAVNVLEAARTPAQKDPELPAFLAALYQRAGRHGDAIKSYQEALATRPQVGRWWVGLGISLETGKDSDAARTAYRRALDTGKLPPNLARYAEDRLKALVR